MILPYSWIKELSGVDWPVEELVRRLTAAGVAGVAEKHQREHFDHVVTGKIVKLEKHPQADKLQVAVVGRVEAEVLEERADVEEAEMTDATVRMALRGPTAQPAQQDPLAGKAGRAPYALIMPP